jgi:hypothetical protein
MKRIKPKYESPVSAPSRFRFPPGSQATVFSCFPSHLNDTNTGLDVNKLNHYWRWIICDNMPRLALRVIPETHGYDRIPREV